MAASLTQIGFLREGAVGRGVGCRLTNESLGVAVRPVASAPLSTYPKVLTHKGITCLKVAANAARAFFS